MADEVNLGLRLAEVTRHCLLVALRVHVVLILLLLQVIIVQNLQRLAATVLWRLEFAQLWVLEVANLARIVKVKVELIGVETESLHIYNITLINIIYGVHLT